MRVQTKKPSLGGVLIFFGATLTQYIGLSMLTKILHIEFPSLIRFITGPTELGDVPTPRTPPKMFVNTDSEQEELVLVVYKVCMVNLIT